MKKTLLTISLFAFAASTLFAQQKPNHISFTEMLSAKKHSSHAERKNSAAKQLPAANSVWKPARMIEWSWDTTGKIGRAHV